MRSCKLTARPGSLVRKNKSTHQPLVPVEIFCNQVRLNFLDCTRKNRDTFGMYIYILYIYLRIYDIELYI